MLRSLFIKATMFAVAIGLILWIQWPTPMQEGQKISGSESGRERGANAIISEEKSEQHGSARGKPFSAGISRAAPLTARLDLNLATLQQLQGLPGVGEVLAKRIIEMRKNKGFYGSSHELLEVKGIGVKRLERMGPFITVKRNNGLMKSSPSQPEQPLSRSLSGNSQLRH